jgi:hypothetical protein
MVAAKSLNATTTISRFMRMTASQQPTEGDVDPDMMEMAPPKTKAVSASPVSKAAFAAAAKAPELVREAKVNTQTFIEALFLLNSSNSALLALLATYSGFV